MINPHPATQYRLVPWAVACGGIARIDIANDSTRSGGRALARLGYGACVVASGATILFASHSGGQIVELCDRAVLMDAGVKAVIVEEPALPEATSEALRRDGSARHDTQQALHR